MTKTSKLLLDMGMELQVRRGAMRNFSQVIQQYVNSQRINADKLMVFVICSRLKFSEVADKNIASKLNTKARKMLLKYLQFIDIRWDPTNKKFKTYNGRLSTYLNQERKIIEEDIMSAFDSDFDMTTLFLNRVEIVEKQVNILNKWLDENLKSSNFMNKFFDAIKHDITNDTVNFNLEVARLYLRTVDSVNRESIV